jgi:UDP-N-acetylglucosamine:LPS N-acetylglucosamine transferase
MKQKKNAILLIAGGGGHLAQMKRLSNLLDLNNVDLEVILLTEKDVSVSIPDINNIFYFEPLRDKYSKWKSIILPPLNLIKHLFLSLELFNKYNIKLCISTGPGIAIIPTLVGKIKRKKIIFIETWSKFYNLTYTARIISKYADVFYVQNKELLVHSKKAIYSGRL